MLVGHVVNRSVPTAHPGDDVRSAARMLLECRCGVLPVVEEDGRGPRVVGLLGYRDAFAATYPRSDTAAIPVAAAMSAPRCTCRASDSLGLALRLLRRTGTEAVAVVDGDGYLVGVLSLADLVRDAAG
jgi:CBS domain-containing protein